MLTNRSDYYETIPGESWLDACRRLQIRGALAVCVGGAVQGLTREARGDARVLHYEDEEGRRVYERSTRFLMLLAARKALPGTRLRVENSIGEGLYVRCDPAPVDTEALKAEMRRIAEAALPFVPTTVSREAAIEHFLSQGEPDTARLLRWRESPTFTLYDCGGVKDYFYGEMVPDTSYVSVFDITPIEDGFVLRLPDVRDLTSAARFTPPEKLLETFRESNRWNRILGVQNASDLNELTKSGGLREFIRVNEALMDMRINAIARSIREKGARLVLIAGPSSSGKTTFCNRLAIALRVLGARPVKLSLDDYYMDRDKAPLDEDGKPDLECVEALDTALIDTQLAAILRGESVEAPRFDFVAQKRSPLTHTVRVDTDAPILIEGIHALNPVLTESIPAKDKFKIYISALTNLNLDDHSRIRTTDARLIRRLVRDSAFRGTPVEETLDMWDSVRRGEDRFIFPYQEEADAMINSALVYELAILKKYIYPRLTAIPVSHPHYTRARRLVKFLNYIQSADLEDEIPLNSLLREFVGGSCFEKD